MKISDFENITLKAPLQTGTHIVTLAEARYHVDKDEDLKGIWIDLEENYKALYIPIFDNNNNYQLEFFMQQIGEATSKPSLAIMNKHKGAKLTVHRYISKNEETGKEYINTSFNPSPKEDITSALAMKLGK